MANVCNLDYLKELSNGNKDFVTKMIQLFLDEIPAEILNLEKDIENKDYESIKQVAHKMKSTLPFVGLHELAEQKLTEIEDLAKKQIDIQKIQSLFFDVKETCRLASEELTSNNFIQM